jgi:hypothetical protein
MTKKITLRFLSFVFLFCLLTQPALAQFAKGGEEKYLLLGATSKTVGYMGPWVAKRKGFLPRRVSTWISDPEIFDHRHPGLDRRVHAFRCDPSIP